MRRLTLATAEKRGMGGDFEHEDVTNRAIAACCCTRVWPDHRLRDEDEVVGVFGRAELDI